MKQTSIFICTVGLVACGGKKDLRFSEDGSSNQSSSASLCFMPGQIAQAPAVRLGPTEYKNTVRVLFGDAVVNSVANDLILIPNETSTSYSTELGVLNAAHIDAYDRVARSLAKAAVANNAFNSQNISCIVAAGTAAPSVACVQNTLNLLGEKIYRRPLYNSEFDFIRAVFDAGRALSNLEGIEVVLRVMLQAAPFLYRIEGSGNDLGNGIRELSPYELASRLSFFITRATPDDLLRLKAANSEILKPDVLSSEVDRLLNSSMGRATMTQFFREWTGYSSLQPLSFPTSDFSVGLPGGDFSAAARTELDSLFNEVFYGNGKFEDIYLSRSSVVDGSLAAVYGMSSSTPANTRVTLDSTNFAGLLTRVGFLANGTTMPSPMHLGATVRRRLLCNTLSAPPPDVTGPVDPGTIVSGRLLSSRERFETKTAEKNCMGCHSQINGLGFAFLDRDGIGRHTGSVEKIFRPNGALIGETTTELQSTPNIHGPDAPVRGVVELSGAIAQSISAKQCFVKSSFNYFASRKPSNEDGCHLQVAVDKINAGGSISDAVKALFLAPEFKFYQSGP